MSVRARIAQLKSRLPPTVRRPLGRVRSAALWLTVGWYYYARARRILHAYGAHYARARRVFALDGHQEGAGLGSLGELGVRIIRPAEPGQILDLPGDFVARVERVADEVHARFGRSAQCVFVPALPPATCLPTDVDDIPAVRAGEVLMIQLRDPLEIAALEEVAAPLMEQMESRIFRSYVVVDKVYVYRSPRSRQAPLGSWLWHYDNHPREIIKVMIYLSNVTTDGGPFEYLRSRSSGAALTAASVTPLYRDSRVPGRVIEEHVANGYERHLVTGPLGTTIVFDDNVIHRANVARTTSRDVVVFQIRPATARLRPYISRSWTGSFQHAPFSPRPEVLEPFVRRLRHFS